MNEQSTNGLPLPKLRTLSPDLDAALVRDFPLLFCERHLDTSVSAMGRGFECPEEMEPAIREFAELAEPYLRLWLDVNPGGQHPRAVQVKEKFDSLRIYIRPPDPVLTDILDLVRKKHGLDPR